MVIWTGGAASDEDERKTDTEEPDSSDTFAPYAQSQEAQWSSTLSSPNSMDQTSPASVPLIPASLVTPLSPLDGDDYMDLLAQISRTGPVPVADEVALAKTMRDNKLAYGQWKNAASTSVRKLLADVLLPEDACTVLLHDTDTILSMLRSPPYVPVLAGRVRRDLFQLIGRDLIALGRARMLAQG